MTLNSDILNNTLLKEIKWSNKDFTNWLQKYSLTKEYASLLLGLKYTTIHAYAKGSIGIPQTTVKLCVLIGREIDRSKDIKGN